MKKLILSTFAVLLSVLGVSFNASADEGSIAFGYCTDQINAVGNGQMKFYFAGAMEIREETAKLFTGAKLTGVQIGFGSTTRTAQVTIFISKELGGDPIYTQQAVMPSKTWTTVELKDPIEITGEKLYIGYYIRTQTAEDYPIGFDGEKEGAQPYSAYMAYTAYGISEMMASFEDVSKDYGHIDIRGIITGDNLPMNCLDVSNIILQNSTPLNTPFTGQIVVRNVGSKPVNSYELSVKVGDAEPTFVKAEDVVINNNTTHSLYLSDLVAVNDGYKLPVVVNVVKVNGETPYLEGSNTGYIMASDNLSTRAVVVEEATGTWCQYCPRGMVAMEYMAEKYADDPYYIGIAAHSGDQMAIGGYAGYFSKYITGYPMATVNRVNSFDISKQTIEYQYELHKIPVEAKIEIEDVTYTNDTRKKGKVDVKTTFAFDYDDANYAITTVVKQNNIGPYLQSNGYSGGFRGELPGFSDAPDPVLCMYDEVATYIDEWDGAVASVPASIQKNTPLAYSTRVDLDPNNLNNTTVVVLLINRNTGEIVTGAQKRLVDTAAVESVVGEEAEAMVANGVISIEGSYEFGEIYTLDGVKVAELRGAETYKGGQGVYVVRINDGKASKSLKVRI